MAHIKPLLDPTFDLLLRVPVAEDPSLVRLRDRETGLVYRVLCWSQTRLPEPRVLFELAPVVGGAAREVSVTAEEGLGATFTRCDLSSPDAPTCDKCGGERVTIPGQRANIGYVCMHCGPKACPTCRGDEVITPNSGMTRPCPTCHPEAYGPSKASATEPAAAGALPSEAPAPPAARTRTDLDGRVARIPDGLPLTPCVLRAWNYASALSALFFGLPVYLVGGAITDPDPRDVDLVIPMPEDLFLAAYNDGRPEDLGAWQSGLRDPNPPPMWRRWARDCAKASRLATMFCGRRVDFKVQPERYFHSFPGPRVRLDCVLMPESPAA